MVTFPDHVSSARRAAILAIYHADPASDPAASFDPHLRKAITLRHAVASLYVSSVLSVRRPRTAGPGGAPGRAGLPRRLARALRGELPVCLDLASLSTAQPRVGGVYPFAREAFGGRARPLWRDGSSGCGTSRAPAAVVLIAGLVPRYAFP